MESIFPIEGQFSAGKCCNISTHILKKTKKMNSIIDLCSSCIKKPKEGNFHGGKEGKSKKKTSFSSLLSPFYQNIRTRSTSFFPLIFNLLTVESCPSFV